MKQQIKIPAVGESITSGLLSVWHKNDGDAVAAGEALFTLETDKAEAFDAVWQTPALPEKDYCAAFKAQMGK